MQLGLLHEFTEIISLLPHLVAFLLALLLGPILDILFKYLFALLRCQQQVPRIEYNLV